MYILKRISQFIGSSLQSINGRSKGMGIMGLLSLVLILMLVSCARMGRPDGGWYDETPPHVVGASPADGGVNVKTKKMRCLLYTSPSPRD